MKRSYFFWIATILALAFGLLTFLAPGFAATQFQLAASPETDTTFRILGSVLLGVAVLNFLVRDQPMSETLKAVLWGDVSIHGIGLVGDIWSAAAGDIPWAGIAVGLVAHLIVLIGALYYLSRPNAA